jgi:Tfp pilus assembly protein PilP
MNGLAGLMINEATVKGVVKSRGRMLAMVQAPDNKTYIVRASDRLLDGEVRAVTAEAVVFVQNVNDPLSPVRQREIRKPLRIVEEGK